MPVRSSGAPGACGMQTGMHRIARAPLLPLTLLVPLLSLSCSTAAGARRAELRRALDQATVSRSPAEIWPEVLRFLHERGYPLVGEDPAAIGLPAQGMVGKLFSAGHQTRVRSDGSRILETNPERSTRSRIRAEALAAGGGASIVRLTVLTQADMNLADYTESKDSELELALLERIDPVAAARVRGEEPARAAAAAPRDAWSPVRHLVGAWTGTLPGGGVVHWRFEFAGEGQFLELRGSPLFFAGSAATEEMGRISRVPGGEGFTWRQFTSGGQVDQYQSEPGLSGSLVFVAKSPESLPAGERVRLTLGRDGEEELVAILERAGAGQEFAVLGEVRLRRAR